MQQYLNKNMKTIQQSSSVITSPVDQKICFFGPEDTCKETGTCDSYKISPEKSIWRHLQEDKLWLTVLEYYYSLCNVSPEKRRQAMNVYIRKRNKHRRGRKESKKYPSYAELCRKLGIVKEDQIDSKENQGKQGDSVVGRVHVSCPLSTVSSDSHACGTDKESDFGRFPVGDSSSKTTESRNSNPPNMNHSQADLTLSSGDQMAESSLQTLSSETGNEGNYANKCRTKCIWSSEKYTNLPVTMDTNLMERLSLSPSSGWNISDDVSLVNYLSEKSSQGRSKVRK